MEIYADHVTPAELTGYAREGLADRAENQFSLARWLPNRTVNDLVFRFNKSTSGLIEAATYRAYDSEPRFGSREGLARVTGELPPIARQMLLNEYDQLRLRSADQEVRDLLLRDAERLTRQINARFEVARGDALVNGSVTIAEDGVSASVSFGRKSAHSVTAATVWSNYSAATVLDDIEAWTQVYSDTNGELPGSILTSTKVARAIMRNDQIRSQLYPNSADRRLTRADLNAFLEEFGLPQITTYDAKVKVNGAEQRIIPEDRFIFLPAPGNPNDELSSDMGATLWGTTLESQEPEYQIESGEQPGIVVAAMKQKTTPIQVVTVASAIGIPILANPDLSFVADVL
jgi:hypothetical protein